MFHRRDRKSTGRSGRQRRQRRRHAPVRHALDLLVGPRKRCLLHRHEQRHLETASRIHARREMGRSLLHRDINRYFSSRTLQLRAPFCAGHRHHWFARRILIWSLAALLPVFLIAMLVAYSSGVRSMIPQLLCVVGSTAVLTSCAIIYGTSIMKARSNKRSIFLSHVHPKFIAALQEQRRWQEARARPASATPRRPQVRIDLQAL